MAGDAALELGGGEGGVGHGEEAEGAETGWVWGDFGG